MEQILPKFALQKYGKKTVVTTLNQYNNKKKTLRDPLMDGWMKGYIYTYIDG